jgi:tetratricopeptide (TPR) repeat protein
VLTEQIAERPKAWALQFRLARIEASLGRISQATAGWQAVIRAERSAPAGLEARQQMAEALLREGQLATTQTLLDEILVASPRDNRALLLRARLSLARGETSGAIDDLRSLARDQPGSGEVIGLLAQAYRSRGEPTLARQLIADSLALYPRAGELVVAQAEHLSATGDAQAALRLLDGAIERDPGLARAWEDKAALLAARGDLPGAARTLEAARAALPGLARIAWRQGRFEAAQGHFAAAALAYERAQSLAPADPALGLDVAEAWRRAGQPDRAEAVYRAQLARDPANDLAANNLAWLLQTRDRPGDLDEALALASRFDVSGSANGLDTLGWVRYRRGDVAGAVPVLRRAVAAAPGRPLLLYHLGAALIDAGQVAEGRSLIARALGLQPDFEGARQARERVAAR